MSVNGRLEFIEKEIRRFETQIKGIQDKSEKLKVEVRLPELRFETIVVLTLHTDYSDTECRPAAATAAAASTRISIEVVCQRHRLEAK